MLFHALRNVLTYAVAFIALLVLFDHDASPDGPHLWTEAVMPFVLFAFVTSGHEMFKLLVAAIAWIEHEPIVMHPTVSLRKRFFILPV